MSPRQTIAMKAAGSLILLAALAWVVDFGALPERMSALSPERLALAAVAVVAAVAVSVVKWGVILARRGHPLPALRLTRHYLVGLFFNNLLPVTLGNIVGGALFVGTAFAFLHGSLGKPKPTAAAKAA